MASVIATAHGRVNLIGEHTDYNGGFVLPAPIPQHTTVRLQVRDDQLVQVYSRTMGGPAGYRLGEEKQRGDWMDYVMGCTHVLRADGHVIRGADLDIESEVPPGAGLSSSAALVVAILRGFREAFNLTMDDLSLALLGQRAENEIVGAPVGMMDHMSASMGMPGHALFIDTRSLETRQVPLPPGDLVVIGSGIRHAHAGGEYQQRRRECEEAARLLGVRLLREIGPADLARVSQLPPPLDRRARHVITENDRVVQAVAAIEQGQFARLGELLLASHISMRDDFAVSLPAIDTLVVIAIADTDVYGARLTGGGFGGSIVVYARPHTGPSVAERVVSQYHSRTNEVATILVGGRESFVPS